MKLLLALAVALPLTLLLSSCPSLQSKVDVAVFAPAEKAWEAVALDYEIGIVDGLADEDITEEEAQALRDNGGRLRVALAMRDTISVSLVPWENMLPWVERGISAQIEATEIGEGVAVSLRLQLSKFAESIERLQGP